MSQSCWRHTTPADPKSRLLLVISCLLAALLLTLTPASAHAQETRETRPLRVDDLFELHRISDPRLSTDGRWVAYTVSRTAVPEDDEDDGDSSTSRIWIVSTEGGEPIPMTAESSSASNPRWSPDGRYLTFLSARKDDQTQVWALDRRGGEAQPLTDVKQGVSAYEWSPDAERLALIIKDPEPDTDEQDDDEDGERDEPWVVTRLQIKRDYVGYLDDRRTHLYVYDLADDSLRQITSGPYDDHSPAWHPDGEQIAFVSNRTEDPDANSNTDIWVVSTDAAGPPAPPRRITTNPGSDDAPAWSSDGNWIAHTTVLEPDLIWYATEHLAISPAQGGQPRPLTRDLDRNVASPRWSPDGRFVYFELEDSAERHLARVQTDGRLLERPVEGPISVNAFDVSPTGTTVVLAGRLDRPADLFVVGSEGLRRLTDANARLFGGIALGEVRNVTYTSRDGAEIEGFVYLPPDFDADRRYPALLRIHGGPVSQYDHDFRFEPHLFAANGYVVIETNPRGSSGYGQDFSRAIWADWGNKDFEDVIAGVDYLVETGLADPDRLGVGGWSYGGILTNYVITKTGRFKGAITGASEVLYRSNYGHDHYQLQWEKELGLPWRNAQAWERISPFNSVENITTPTLILGGEKDWNVPIINSEQLYQALRRLGRTTELVVYPSEHHGIRKPAFQKDRLQRYLDWYGRYVKG